MTNLKEGWYFLLKHIPLLLFLLLFTGAIIACVFFCLAKFNPLTNIEYVIKCVDNEEINTLVYNTSRLEGMVVVLQRMLPIFVSLLIAVILFLTWKHGEMAKSTARNEIESNFQSYVDRLTRIEADAKQKLSEIEAQHTMMMAMKDQTLGELLTGVDLNLRQE